MGSLKAYSRPHKGTYLDPFCSLSSGNQNLARQALPDRLCPTSPLVKQKPDRKHQPAPTSWEAVCSSARKHSPRKFPPRTVGDVSKPPSAN
ncbi:hypothetical protein ACFX2B_029493 [Malus domestica]